MPQPDDRLDFSQKQVRPHTIEEPHSTPIPASLLDWLVSILSRLRSTQAPASSEENQNDNET
jgi:hypothetical protein